jgi:AcrR family transcriptional regulator/NAD(P)-dependent dehydrogenase (short-subunit alcohol dehydrogenase family)
MNKIPTTVKNKELVEKRRSQIILAAIKIFSQKGYHKATLRELADEAGLSYGNVYDYVGSKEDIFSLIHDYAANLTVKALQDSIANVTDPVEKLRRIVRAEFKLMDLFADAILLIYQESHILSKPFLHRLLKKERQHVELIEKAIEESINKGQLRKCNIRLTANFIKSMIDAWVIKRWDLRGFANRLEAEQSIMDLVFNGLLAEQRTEASLYHKPQLSSYQSPNSLRGHTALLVNSGTPIGTEICNSLQSRGVKLAIHSAPYTPTRENPVSCELGSEVTFYSTSDYGVMTAGLYKQIEKDLGQVDIFIHDLGSGVLDINVSQGVDTGGRLDVNLRVAEEIAGMFQKDIERKTPHRVIFIAPWGWDRYLDEIQFEIAKAGAIALTHSLAKHMSKKGMNVNCIVPGFIKTTRPSSLEKQLGEAVRKKIPIGFMGDINDVVETIFYLSGDAAKYITGQIINVSGGLV